MAKKKPQSDSNGETTVSEEEISKLQKEMKEALAKKKTALKKIFAVKLNAAIKVHNGGNDMSNAELARNSAISEKKIGQWRKETGAFPRNPAELALLAKHIGASLDDLFAIEVPPRNTGSRYVRFSLGKNSKEATSLYEQALARLLEEDTDEKGETAKIEEIWFLCRTGFSLFNWNGREEVRRRMIEDDLRVRLLLSTKEQKREVNKETGEIQIIQDNHFWTQHFAGWRRDDWPKEPEMIASHTNGTIGLFQQFAQEAEAEAPENEEWQGELNIRTMLYAPTVCSHIVKSRKGHGKAVIMIFNFRTTFVQTPILEINEAENEQLFLWFVNDYERHWKAEGNLTIRDDHARKTAK